MRNFEFQKASLDTLKVREHEVKSTFKEFICETQELKIILNVVYTQHIPRSFS
jgi:hypothetical protein